MKCRIAAREVLFDMRRATVAGIILGVGLTILLVEAVHARLTAPASAGDAARREALVRQLGLTDLALFTEARYVRHLSQADMFTPFQDAPSAFEHFPSGTLVAPPAHLKRHGGRLSARPIGPIERRLP